MRAARWPHTGREIPVTRRASLWAARWLTTDWRARLSVWYRKDGGWIDRINPDTLALSTRRANYTDSTVARLAFDLGSERHLVNFAELLL